MSAIDEDPHSSDPAQRLGDSAGQTRLGGEMARFRALSAAALAGVLCTAGLAAGPALADDPLEWSLVPGYPQAVGDVTVTWETASSTSSPFNDSEMLDEMPVYRPDIVNDSAETRYFGLGTDFTAQGSVDQLWRADAWGAFGELAGSSFVTDLFWAELPPGASLSSGATAGGADTWYASGTPAWSGHTVTLFELSEAPVGDAVPTATPLASITTPGRFVAADLSGGDIDNLSAVLGQRATVSSTSGSPDIFRGLTSMIEASGLPTGETLELWVARDLNYAFFQILGGGLPVGAIKVGQGTVAADGTLVAPFTLPLDLGWDPGETEVNYQLVAGVRAERYWPAGSYDDFVVKPAPNEASAASDAGESTVAIDLLPTLLGPTQVQVTFPDGTTAGTTTAIVSPTGPLPSGFTIASDPPLYLHLVTTAILGGPAEVCIAYDENTVSGDPPHLYHFDSATAAWHDITTSSEAGTVCGVTSGFSPFALGHPTAEPFDFSGFFPPVSMDAENIAKAGQAIPVKFSLGGDRGLDVITSAQFVSEGTATSFAGETVDAVSAGHSGLTYSAADDRYTYVWKTPKDLAKKTGAFVLTLSDGTTHEFAVTFRK